MALAEATEGGCFCGALRFRFEGPPLGSMVCHCQSCRRLFAAPVVAWLTVASDRFEITRGKPAEMNSSPPVKRWFCSGCGTHIGYQHAESLDSVEVATCALDEPNQFPPTHHSWLSHDLAWVKFGDGLPSFPRSRYE